MTRMMGNSAFFQFFLLHKYIYIGLFDWSSDSSLITEVLDGHCILVLKWVDEFLVGFAFEVSAFGLEDSVGVATS